VLAEGVHYYCFMVYLDFLVLVVAILHINFLILEMFFWTDPVGLKIFRQSLENAKTSKVLAANQGLYNGFLSLGLIWGLVHPNVIFGFQIKMFFLGCVVVAGIYGALTVSRKIFWIQAGPAILSIILLLYFN
jgi:putative membrane protein